jgi:hypothetical protein
MEVWVKTIEDTCDKTSNNLRQSRIGRHCSASDICALLVVRGGTQPEEDVPSFKSFLAHFKPFPHGSPTISRKRYTALISVLILYVRQKAPRVSS